MWRSVKKRIFKYLPNGLPQWETASLRRTILKLHPRSDQQQCPLSGARKVYQIVAQA